MKKTTQKEYFGYKTATSSSAFISLFVFLNFFQSWNLIIGGRNPQTVLLYVSLILLFLTFIFLLISVAHFVIPVATLDDKCFSIKKAILRRMKRIPLEHITDIRYDNWENYLYITYTQNAQQISDKFYLSSLFYEDTRRWLLLELGEALEKYNITLQYGRLRKIDALPERVK